MAANPVVPTPELQFNTEKKLEETVVHGSGRITSATSDLLQRTIRGLIPGTKPLCWTWRRSTTSTVLASVLWSVFTWPPAEHRVFWSW